MFPVSALIVKIISSSCHSSGKLISSVVLSTLLSSSSFICSNITKLNYVTVYSFSSMNIRKVRRKVLSTSLE